MRERTADFESPARRAFRLYLRTGRTMPNGGEIELKFNPYHDPRNGQFTFAPGGPKSLADVLVSPSNYASNPGGPTGRTGRGRRARGNARSNIENFYEPMLLQQVFPGINSPAGRAIISAADQFFDITGPASELSAELVFRQANVLLAEIRKIDPKYRSGTPGLLPRTAAGRETYLDGLRMDRAAAYYRIRGEAGPLQVETLRFLQKRVDAAYAKGVELLKAGKIVTRPSDRIGLGNFVDFTVRRELRELYNQYDIVGGANLPVRVVGREYRTVDADRAYSIPDSRVGKVAFDMTLERKTLATPQIRNFFASDFQPDVVVIVRPSQLGPGSTYAIPRPRK